MRFVIAVTDVKQHIFPKYLYEITKDKYKRSRVNYFHCRIELVSIGI